MLTRKPCSCREIASDLIVIDGEEILSGDKYWCFPHDVAPDDKTGHFAPYWTHNSEIDYGDT